MSSESPPHDDVLPEESRFPALFARHLCRRKDALVNTWIDELKARRDIPSADALSWRELLDHMPQLFDELADQLQRAAQNDSVIAANARVHGGHRWRQGFQRDELIREATSLRGLIVEELKSFGQLDYATVDQDKNIALNIVRTFFDELTIGSVQEFMAERQRELEGVNAALVTAIQQSHELADARLRLLQTVSHELRNAANALTAVTTLLHEAGTEPDVREECVILLRRNLEEMNSLLNGLLDYSASLANQYQLKLEHVDLCDLLRELESAFRPVAERKGLRFAAACAPSLKELHTDRLKLKQITQNLLSNAIKFTASGQVSLAFLDSVDSLWAIQVKDSGRGISTENQTKLFHEFERLGADDIPGTGLGLTIVQHLASALGGEVTVQSEPGRGSTFEVRLPQAPPSVTESP